MPTLKDIQEQGEKEFQDKFGIGYFSLRTPSEIRNHFKSFLHQQTTLAFQAGLDMVLKEIEGMKKKKIVNMLQDDEIFNENGMDGVIGFNQALSSLKEKIISNSK